MPQISQSVRPAPALAAWALARLELGLAASPYLVGELLTLADVALVAYTRWAHEGGFDLQPYPKVRAWIDRIERDLNILD